jgi:hypothetical protein
MFNIEWCFDVDINRSVDPRKWILKLEWGGSQDSSLEPYNQVVKVKEGRVDLEPVLPINCRVAESPNILLDTYLDKYHFSLWHSRLGCCGWVIIAGLGMLSLEQNIYNRAPRHPNNKNCQTA